MGVNDLLVINFAIYTSVEISIDLQIIWLFPRYVCISSTNVKRLRMREFVFLRST